MDEVRQGDCKYKNCGRCGRVECQRTAARWSREELRHDTVRLGLLVLAAVVVRAARVALETAAKIRERVAVASRQMKDTNGTAANRGEG